MTPQLTASREAITIRTTDTSVLTSTDRLTLTLLCAGLAAALVAYVSYEEALRTQLGTDQLFASTIVKSGTYYSAYAAQITLVFAAGCLALLSTNFRKLLPRYLLWFGLLLASATVMAARGYSLPDLLSTKLVDATGPAAFFMSVAVFIGTRRANWTVLRPIMAALAAAFSLLTFWGMAHMQSFSRQDGVENLAQYLNALYWPAAWVALDEYSHRSPLRSLRFIPMIIFAGASLFTQTRLNFVMVIAFVMVLAYIQHRRGAPQTAGWVMALAGCIWLILFTAVFLRQTRMFGTVESVSDAFSSRLNEDTRSDQLISFAADVSPAELVVGRGSFATWDWDGTTWGGVDLGYLTLLFYGGIPLLLTYVLTHITPGMVLFRQHSGNLQMTAAAIVMLWALRMWSSSYPSPNLDYYPILFCIGACISSDCRESRLG